MRFIRERAHVCVQKSREQELRARASVCRYVKHVNIDVRCKTSLTSRTKFTYSMKTFTSGHFDTLLSHPQFILHKNCIV